MKFPLLRSLMLHIVSMALVFGGFAQVSHAGVIETGYVVHQDVRVARLERVDAFLASESVARQLESLGVDKALVAERVQALSDEELLLLEQEMDAQAAGGDALALLGGVFLVLLVLELLGVTDVFKRI